MCFKTVLWRHNMEPLLSFMRIMETSASLRTIIPKEVRGGCIGLKWDQMLIGTCLRYAGWVPMACLCRRAMPRHDIPWQLRWKIALDIAKVYQPDCIFYNCFNLADCSSNILSRACATCIRSHLQLSTEISVHQIFL